MTTSADKFKENLNDLSQQFFLVAGRYKSALTEYYLANTQENKNRVDSAKQLITKMYAKVFVLGGTIHNTILENNKDIQSLDEYLDMLKNKVDKENKLLQNAENSGQGAIPRKEYIRKTMQQDYYMDAFYFVAILGGGFFLYQMYNK